MDEFVDFLHSQLHLLPSQIELLKEKIKTHYFKKGDLLEGPAELDDRMYYIKKGGARSFYLKDGKDITFSFAFENDLLVSMRSNQKRISRTGRISRRNRSLFDIDKTIFKNPKIQKPRCSRLLTGSFIKI